MNEEAIVYERHDDMALMRPPALVMAQAREAAMVLKDTVSKKPKPVMMNGEQYLEFEDWQTVGKFYGITAKVESTTFIDYGGVRGFEARAVALSSDGRVISAADSMCLNDEPKWSTRAKYEYVNGSRKKVGEEPVPLFQLRSMAQTRACAKALRNVLSWVVVLAGYKTTPAEEIKDMADNGSGAGKQAPKQPQSKFQGAVTGKQAQGASEHEVVIVESVSTKRGNKNGKDWQAWTIHAAGDEKYGTFSESLAGIAVAGETVKIGFTVGKFGKEIVSIEPCDETPVSTDPQGCPKDSGQCSDTQFGDDMNVLCGLNNNTPCPHA